MISERMYLRFIGFQSHCAQHLYICGEQNAGSGHDLEMHEFKMHGFEMHGSAGTMTCSSECALSTVVTSGSLLKRAKTAVPAGHLHVLPGACSGHVSANKELASVQNPHTLATC